MLFLYFHILYKDNQLLRMQTFCMEHVALALSLFARHHAATKDPLPLTWLRFQNETA